MVSLFHRATIKNESKHSEMGPVRQNSIQRTVSLFICVCIALCTIVAHNIAQNRPDSFPPYPPDNHHCSDDVHLREGGGATERPTDRRRYSVRCGVIMCNYVGYGKATQSFHVSTNNLSTIKSPSVRSKHLIKYLV